MKKANINTSVMCRSESEVWILAEDPLDVCDFMLQFGRMFLRNENGWLVYDMAK